MLGVLAAIAAIALAIVLAVWFVATIALRLSDWKEEDECDTR